MRPRPRRHTLAAVGCGNGFVFADIRIKYGHCLFIRQFEDICIQMKHLRRRFPTMWAARHFSPGRTMMQNGPSDVAERAISQCQTAHIAVSDGPFCRAWRAQGPDVVARVAALRSHSCRADGPWRLGVAYGHVARRRVARLIMCRYFAARRQGPGLH